jgi:hypothetical protein
VDRHTKNMGIGVIIRDCKGSVLATLSAPRDHIIDPGIAETI